jgi:hypothetical protein
MAFFYSFFHVFIDPRYRKFQEARIAQRILNASIISAKMLLLVSALISCAGIQPPPVSADGGIIKYGQ